jgi:subtilisin family serine protease
VYIFQFQYNLSAENKNAFFNSFTAVQGHKIRKVFQILDFHAFSAETSEMYVAAQKQNELFIAIEQDATVHIEQHACVTQTGATWGIDRISERALQLDGEYEYEYDGSKTDSYIIDTGILLTHNEFGTNRATHGATFTGDGRNEDCNGHGTHVAGTVGGTLYGVAKKVSLIAVKVLNCGGSGTWEGVMGGVNWVAQQYTEKKKPSTANMSLGGGRHVPLNNAVEACVRAGVVVVVAGGNSNADACNFSPASALLAITVGSTDVANSGGVQTDIRSSFSNFGRCTDMWGPGTMVTSAWIGSNTATRTISGTSMASPHVCGVANLILDENPTWSPKQVEDEMIEKSTKGIINLACGNRAPCLESPNRMVYSACDV